MKEKVKKILDETLQRYSALEQCREQISAAFECIAAAYGRGGKLLLCGNGGSASDCEHIVGELMKSFKLPRTLGEEEKQKLSACGEPGRIAAEGLECGLPAISLTSHPSLSTAFANDRDPLLAFAQQLYVLGREEDVLLAITTSGNSKNCLCAAAVARAKGMKVVFLTGAGGGKAVSCADVCIRVPQTQTYLVQELHLPVYHCLCAMLEEEFFAE